MNGKTKKKILVIDDDPVACDVLTASLTSRGYDVLIVSDPVASLEKARQTLPDLIFVSLLLPGTNGLKVSKSIQTLNELRGTPVLMMISRAGELDPKYTVTIGIVDVLVKPLVPEEVITKTVQILEKSAVFHQRAAEDEPFDAFALEEGEGTPSATASAAKAAGSSPRAATPPFPGKKGPDIPEDTSSLFSDIAEDTISEDAKHKGMLQDEVGQTGEEAQEFSYEDEYDSYKETEKQNTKKIILLASALFVIILIGIGVFFMKDSLFPSRKAPSLAGIEPVMPGNVVSTEPAGTPSRPEGERTQTDASSPPVAAVKKEVPPQLPPAKSSGDPAKKQLTPAETPVKQLSRKESTLAEKIVKVPAESGKGGFIVQAGVFENKKNAETLSAKLKKKGYKSSVVKGQGRNKKPLYRVTVGSYTSRSAAVQQSNTLLEKEGIKSVVRQQ